MEISKSSLVSCLDSGGMASASGIYEQVVSEGPGDALHASDEESPRVEQERYQCHAKWAALGDAAWVVMWFPKSSSYGVVVKALTVKGSIGPQRSRRKSSNFKKGNEELELDLIRTFKNVCRSTADGEVIEARLFKS